MEAFSVEDVKFLTHLDETGLVRFLELSVVFLSSLKTWVDPWRE